MYKKIIYILLCCALILIACSNQNNITSEKEMPIKQDQEKENWQFEGYVIDYKKDMQGGHQYLMAWGVQDERMNNHTVDQILKIADPNAMWISIPETSANNIQLGDKIKVKTTGTINDSFPAQAAAELVEVDKGAEKLNIS